ncbi:MAG TPA: leucyl aminopeptidase family protein [Solirubrobacteraceae bacterium]
MHVEASTDSSLATAADAVAVGVFEGEELSDAPGAGELQALLDSGEGARAFERVALTHHRGQRLILVGLGSRRQFDGERARIAAALAQRRAVQARALSLCWVLPRQVEPEIVEGFVHGTVLGAYRFRRYRPPPADEALGLRSLILSTEDDVAAPVHRASVLAAAQNRARDLANTPANDLTPAALADYARQLGDRHRAISATILDGAEIRARGMGAFAAVAQGSDQDPRLIALEYDGGAASSPRLALIGKAVTFDTGGLWLKPTTSQIDMKFDMCGGAAVIEAVAALAELRAPVRLLAVIGATENMINGHAMRPGDIVTALDGTTIEVNNTDAEGRLVLADCITYARQQGCDAIIDIATLTGAVKVALGSMYAGMMSNHDSLAELVQDCGRRTGEPVWRLPLHPAYAALVKGRYAQLTNRPERREATAITAAELLHHFVGDVPWVHLDIGGTADHGHAAYHDKGGTGFGVRLLSEVALGFTG